MIASEGNDAIAPVLSESPDGHSQIATSDVLTLYRCMAKKTLDCVFILTVIGRSMQAN
jgi:hypothetical protein